MKNLIFLVVILCMSISAVAQEQVVRRRNFNHDNGVAMKDFDPVSYFNGKALKGDVKYEYFYKGIKYHFANAENMEAFKKTPGKYEPAYGGWCAYSMSQNGQRVKVDPATYKIVEGKLYLFSNFNGKNTLLLWNKNEAKCIADANKFWVKNMN